MSSPFINEVKERPILFSAEMVKAILEGRKTQTRRIIKKPNLLQAIEEWSEENPYKKELSDAQKCPYGQVGDRLWIRENFKVSNIDEGYQNQFVIDDFEAPACVVEYEDGSKRKIELEHSEYLQAVRANKKKKSPSIHMPRWASRIILEITDIRIERLQDITEQDAIAEGCDNSKSEAAINIGWYEKSKRAFERLWDGINKERGFDWSTNPYVWVIEFRRINNE